MEPVIVGIFKAIGVALAEGGGGIKLAIEALGFISLLDWMSNHIAISLGAGAVVGLGIFKAAQKSPPSST
jgi:hypothetical protein